MRLDLDTRTSVLFVAALVGLGWQAGVAATGGEPSGALVTAFVTILLATIGIGIGKNGKDGNTKGRDGSSE